MNLSFITENLVFFADFLGYGRKKGWESSFITGNYEKLFVSLDDFCLPSNEGMRHVWAWELYGLL